MVWGCYIIFFGIEVYQDADGVFLCQKKYAEKNLKKFGMADCKSATTPRC